MQRRSEKRGYHAVAKRAEAERAEVERKTEAEEERKTEAEEERTLKMKGTAEIEAEPCNISSEVVTPPEAGEQEGGSRESARLHAPSKRYAGNDWVRYYTVVHNCVSIKCMHVWYVNYSEVYFKP